jgi:hypothetical protein
MVSGNDDSAFTADLGRPSGNGSHIIQIGINVRTIHHIIVKTYF